MPAGQGKKPSAFTFANVSESLSLTPDDNVLFVDDATNNPDKWEYFFPYVIVAGNVSISDTKGVTRNLVAVPAFTLIAIPSVRLRSTGTTGTVLALIPDRY